MPAVSRNGSCQARSCRFMTAPSHRRVSVRRGRRPASAATPSPGRPPPAGRRPPRRAAAAGSAPPGSGTAGRGGRPIDIDLDELEPPERVRGQLFQRGADHAAGARTRSPRNPPAPDRRTARPLGEVVVAGLHDPRKRCRQLPQRGTPWAAAGTRLRFGHTDGQVPGVRRPGRLGGHAAAAGQDVVGDDHFAVLVEVRWIVDRRGTRCAIAPCAILVSTSRAMYRRNGRAPYTGS